MPQETLLQCMMKRSALRPALSCPPQFLQKDKRALLEASAKLSKLAYFEPDFLEATKPYMYYTSPDTATASSVCNLHLEYTCASSYPRFANNDDAQAYLWKFNESDTLFIVFRGTRGMGDGLDNIDVRQIPFHSNGVYVHSGFHRQFTQILQELDAYLEKDAGNKSIVFCGHSLGGAIATLASVHFADKYAVSCYTFGSPRVGNTKFCRLFESSVKDHMRVVNSNDPVPMIPISFRFEHVGPALVVDDDCNVYEVKKDIPWYVRIFYHLVKLDMFHLIRDHKAEVYIERLGKMVASWKQSP